MTATWTSIFHDMNMSDKLVFSLINIYREFHDKTALNFILYKVQNFYIGKMCISAFYFITYMVSFLFKLLKHWPV